jgi:hypothetical protein
MPEDNAALALESGRVREEFNKLGHCTLTPEVVHLHIIVQDLNALFEEARREIGAKGVLILIDDLHRHEGAWEQVLGSIGKHGLGTAAVPAPVVFTYSTREKAGPQIVNFIRQNSSKFLVHALERFQKGEERTMAYRQSLLSRKLVPSSDPSFQTFVGNIFKRFDTLTEGIPSYLLIDKLASQLEADIVNEFLVTADDSAILASARDFDGV